MNNQVSYNVDKRYVKGDLSKKPDYGWKLGGKTVLLLEDKSVLYDDFASQMQAALRDMSMEFFYLDRCLQCGMCTNWCSNSLIKSERNFSPRELIQRLRLGLLDLSGEELWFCTNCGGCTINCPHEIPLIEVISSLRNLVVREGAGYLPASIKSMLSSVKAFQNPWMEKAGKGTEWLRDSHEQFSRDEKRALFFLGCLPYYDSRAKKIAEAAMQLLDQIGVDFITLGTKEACCGDGVRSVGDFDTFEKLKTLNKSNMEALGVNNIYSLSPHCSHIMNTKYFDKDEKLISVKPFMLLLHEALQKGTLLFSKPINNTVTYHDPCFLAKHHNIYNEPREILGAIEGVRIIEMKHNRKAGICCGGGGGGVWLDRRKGERLSEIRLTEALSSEADIILTACPFCLSMLEDAAKSEGKFEHIQIMDICEFIVKAL